MRKKIGFIIIVLSVILSICLCKTTQNEGVTTIIKDSKNMLIAINYPKTKYKTLNKEIERYVEETYNNFKDAYENFFGLGNKAELNIDYEYHQVDDRYLSITLYTYIDSHTLSLPLKTIYSFLYDCKKGTYHLLPDIVKNKKEMNVYIKDSLKQKYASYGTEEIDVPNELGAWPFTIDSKKVSLYIPTGKPEFAYYVVHIPLEYFEIGHIEKEEKAFQYTPKLSTIDPTAKVIALTFDDGPTKYTKDVLKILKKYKVTATFFVLGNKVPMYAETLKEVLTSGNEIGNHSYNHKLMSRLDKDSLLEQIDMTQKIIKEELDYTPVSLRPTYGSVNDKIRNNSSLKIVLWTVDTLDWKIKDSKKIAKRGLKVKDGDIILMHDAKERTVKALDIIIPKLLEEGYQFVTTSELEETKLLRKRL